MLDEVDNHDQLIRRYLLGGLTPRQREQVEQTVFTDSQYKERVQLIEAELIDEYLDGELTGDERSTFARHFLANPHQRLNVRIVEELKQLALQEEVRATAAEVAPPEPPNLVPAPSPHRNWLAALRRQQMPLLVACLVLLIFSAGLILWFKSESPQLENRLLYGHSPRANLEKEIARLNTPGNEEQAHAALEARAAISTRVELTPGILRDAPGEDVYPSLDVPVDAQYARLQLKLEQAASKYQGFRALFTAVDSGDQFEADLLPSGDGGERIVEIILPLYMLSNGDYQIQLHGRDATARLEELPDHYYHLRLIRRSR